MRLVFLSQIVPYPPHGGVLQRGFNLIRHLSTHCRIHLLAFVHPDVLPTQSSIDDSRVALLRYCESVNYSPLWPKRSTVHKLAAMGANLALREPFSATAHRSPSFGRLMRAAMQQFQPDVVHFDTIGLAPYLTWTSPVPCVLTHHNIESVLMRRRAEHERRYPARIYLHRQAQLLERWERTVAHQFDLNVTVSRTDQHALSHLGGPRDAVVIPNGVDLDYYSVRPRTETQTLIYTGGMNMFANRDAVTFFLDSVWPRLTAVVPHIEFYAIGQDPPRELLALADEDSRVKVTGFVDDIRPYVARSAVYVVPLRVGGGTRLKVLDAMAQGKAIVSTAIGVEGLDLEPGVHYECADDAERMSEIIQALLRDPERRRSLGDSARRRAEERYSWRRIADDLASEYARIVRPNGTCIKGLK